jgi:hypothetical protein
VTNAAVVTNGPATVATGDLGTCATAATDGVNPTGCSLPGTPVAVNANVINTNSFTNTINSVTPTTHDDGQPADLCKVAGFRNGGQSIRHGARAGWPRGL